MHIAYETSIQLLSRTPDTIQAMLGGLPDALAHSNEGEHTWSPAQVTGHLIVCEEINFFPRIALAFSSKPDKTFEPMDMDIHLHRFGDRPVQSLLDEFREKRLTNIAKLSSLSPTGVQWQMTGIHPALGKVTAWQILGAWVVHDHAHLVQLARILAWQYREQAGPFAEFLRIIKQIK